MGEPSFRKVGSRATTMDGIIIRAATASGWLAVGFAGTTYGETDDFSYNIVKNPVEIHDLNATMLHLLGLEHTRFTYRHQGRDYRLTDLHGSVVEGLLT